MHNAGRRDWWWWWFARPVRRAVAARYARGRHRAPVYLPRSPMRSPYRLAQINLLSRKTYLSTKMTDCIPRRPQRGRAPQGLSVHNLLREDAACAPASRGGDHSGTRLLTPSNSSSSTPSRNLGPTARLCRGPPSSDRTRAATRAAPTGARLSPARCCRRSASLSRRDGRALARDLLGAP